MHSYDCPGPVLLYKVTTLCQQDKADMPEAIGGTDPDIICMMCLPMKTYAKDQLIN